MGPTKRAGGRGQERGGDNLMGEACIPVGLQNVNDSNVQQQPLPTPIHGRDPAHPAVRGQVGDSGGGHAGVAGPLEAALGPRLSRHGTPPCTCTLHPGHGCLALPQVNAPGLPQEGINCPRPVSDPPRCHSGPKRHRLSSLHTGRTGSPGPLGAPRRPYKSQDDLRGGGCTVPLLFSLHS